MVHVVMLDRNALADDVPIRPLQHPHTWQDYPATRPEQVVERLHDADIAVLSKVAIKRETLAACPRLKHIAVSATGYNIIDLEACREHQVSVSNIPSYAADTVAEHVIACIFSLRRELIQYRQKVIEGAWQTSPGFCLFDKPVNEIRGATLGIVGLGEIGTATARLANAVGMRVVYSARRPLSLDFATQVDFDQLIAHSDVISLHCSLNHSTRNLINQTELQRMPEHAILINTARGGIVDETALVAAIEQQQIAGTAVDVLAQEPPADDSPLLSIAERSNVIITPHISWTNVQAMQVLADTLINNIEAFISGTPQNLVSSST